MEDLGIEMESGLFGSSEAKATGIAAENHLVRCNVCGWRRPKSVSEPCPKGHTTGFSYDGPLEEAEPEVGEPVEAVLGDEVISGPLTVEADPEMEAIASEDGDGPLEMTVKASEPEAAEEPAIPSEIQAPDDDFEVVREALDRGREGLRRIFAKRKSVEKAHLAFADADRKAKGLKKRWESEVEELDQIILEVEEDQQELPLEKVGILSDPRKEQINVAFAKPEAIQPLPADTPEEFYRRKKRDARFADMPLKPKIVEILEGAGYHTVLDLDKLHEAQADITTIRSDAGKITEKRGEEIRDVLGRLAESWVAEWESLHPETAEADAPPAGTDPAPPVGDGDPPIGDPSTPIGPVLPAMDS
jgi:hypothetical protein